MALPFLFSGSKWRGQRECLGMEPCLAQFLLNHSLTMRVFGLKVVEN